MTGVHQSNNINVVDNHKLYGSLTLKAAILAEHEPTVIANETDITIVACGGHNIKYGTSTEVQSTLCCTSFSAGKGRLYTKTPNVARDND